MEVLHHISKVAWRKVIVGAEHPLLSAIAEKRVGNSLDPAGREIILRASPRECEARRIFSPRTAGFSLERCSALSWNALASLASCASALTVVR